VRNAAHSRTQSRTRIRRGVLVTAGALALVATPAAIAATSATGASTAGQPHTEDQAVVAYGGFEYIDPPVVTALECRVRCSASASKNAKTAKVAAVRDNGTLRIKGRNLASVVQVIFNGRSGRADDIGVPVQTAAARTIDLIVSPNAQSGPITLVARNARQFSGGTAKVTIFHDAPKAPTGPAPKLIWPVTGPITGPFGEWRGDHYHSGIDIALPSGSPIKAAADGIVTLRANYGGYGNFTCVTHTTITTCYAHQSQYLVNYGDHVKQGQVIGRVGCTGNCSGDHLHFEVRLGTSPQSKPVDPMLYLPRKQS
jgi:murein DD-endopeptidase MepM/ murein hydrolase activator NlpD